MFSFRAVPYLLTQNRIHSYRDYLGTVNSQLKKFSANTTLLVDKKAEVKFPYNRIYISNNRRGHKSFAVFLLSFFGRMYHKVAANVGCRSPPFNLNEFRIYETARSIAGKSLLNSD